MMKYRHNKVKREHGIIQDALTWLEELSQYPEVTDIIPGVIQVSRSPERGIVYKYETQTGCKILLKSNGSIQEAFVVTKTPEFVRQWAANRFPLFSEKLSSPNTNKQSESKTRKTEQSQVQSMQKVQKSQKSIPDNPRLMTKKRVSKSSRSEKYLEKNHLGLIEQELPNLGQRLNSKTRQALRTLQKNLNQASHEKK
jgi:hypothetical protein